MNQPRYHVMQTTYNWRVCNAFRLYINAEKFYPAMLKYIAQAQSFVLFEMYLVESGDSADGFIEVMLKAADRGVKLYILLDDFGSMGLSEKDKKRLQHDNIFLTFYNPLRYGTIRRNLFRDHRKLLVVDQQIAFVGGAGITDAFRTYSKKSPGWRETMVSIQGECVFDWIKLFNEVWQMYSTEMIPRFHNMDGHPAYRQLGRINSVRGRSRQGIKRALLTHIRQAKTRIWISTAYFLPTLELRHVLIKAVQRGIDVRLLLPGPKTDHPAVRQAGHRYYYKLLHAGVNIFEYQPSFIHQKVLLCDNWVSIGSSNLDRWNFRWNLEANQEINDDAFTQQIKQMFENDFSQCELIEFKNWNKRPWYLKMQEWLWGVVDRTIDRNFK